MICNPLWCNNPRNSNLGPCVWEQVIGKSTVAAEYITKCLKSLESLHYISAIQEYFLQRQHKIHTMSALLLLLILFSVWHDTFLLFHALIS